MAPNDGACIDFYYSERFPKKLYAETAIGSQKVSESRINNLIDGVRFYENEKYFQIFWLTELEFVYDSKLFSFFKQ